MSFYPVAQIHTLSIVAWFQLLYPKDTNLPRVEFATPAYADARGHSTCGQTRTSLNHLKNVLSYVNLSYHVPFRLHRYTWKRTSITKSLVNSRKYTSRRNPSIGKTPLVFYSSTCIDIAKSIHKMHVTIFHVGKHKRHFSSSFQITYQPFRTLQYTTTYHPEASTGPMCSLLISC